jgi:hypothetical protein
MSKYPPLYDRKAKPKGTAWYLRPLFARGAYSPRLTMAWVFALFMLWLIRRWITYEPQVVNGILLQAPAITEVVGILAALIASLVGLGTLQKVKLGDASPSPGEIEAGSQAENHDGSQNP